VSDYQRLIQELAGTVTRRVADLTAAERAYHDGIAAAEAELRRAEAAAAEADRRAAAAASAVVEVDNTAERLWAEFRGRTWPGQRGGSAPEPAPVTVQPTLDLDDNTTTRTLNRVARQIEAARRADTDFVGNHARLPLRVPPLLPLVGAAATAVAGLLASGLVAMADAGPPGAGLLRAAGWLAYFAAPFAGIPLAAVWLKRRWAARLDTGGVALTIFGGLWSLCAVIIALS